MPALAKPRHEAFARAIVAGLVNSTRESFSQGRAYVAAGYQAKDAGMSGGSAEVCAARLLKKVQPISDRVRELQAEANERIERKLDVSRERVGRRLDLASRMAENAQLPSPSAIVSAELGIAKVFGHITDKHEDVTQSFAQAKSMRDIGIGLLAQVGHSAPSDADISLAIEANDVLVATLEAIRDRASGAVNN